MKMQRIRIPRSFWLYVGAAFVLHLGLYLYIWRWLGPDAYGTLIRSQFLEAGGEQIIVPAWYMFGYLGVGTGVALGNLVLALLMRNMRSVNRKNRRFGYHLIAVSTIGISILLGVYVIVVGMENQI